MVRVESKVTMVVFSLNEAVAEAMPGSFSTDSFTVLSQPSQVMPSTAKVMVLLACILEALADAASFFGALLQASRANNSVQVISVFFNMMFVFRKRQSYNEFREVCKNPDIIISFKGFIANIGLKQYPTGREALVR